jgi:hypothetical protein
MSFRNSYSGRDRNSSWNRSYDTPPKRNVSAKQKPLKSINNSPSSGYGYSPKYKQPTKTYNYSPPVYGNYRSPDSYRPTQRSNSLNRLNSNTRPASNTRINTNRSNSNTRLGSTRSSRNTSRDFIKLNKDRVASLSPLPAARRLDFDSSHFSRRASGSRTASLNRQRRNMSADSGSLLRGEDSESEGSFVSAPVRRDDGGDESDFETRLDLLSRYLQEKI